jgi:predicted HTH transcriptional regulator
MRKIKVFISSVQSEFADERQMLFDYLMQDPLLGLFFEPFIFERVPASSQRADNVYLDKVAECDVYLGVFGKEYGLPDNTGTSPTEYEYSHATNLNKVRLIFISHHSHTERHTKITDLIKRAEKEIVRKKFSNPSELKTAVYTSLVRYLEEKEYIRTGPFDASICAAASLTDIDIEKIIRFVTIAKAKRGFPLPAESPVKDILTHLNLLQGDKLTNAALLLFGKKPQRFFMSSEIKCAQFHGYEIVKPIPTYQVYKGDVFQLVDQAVDFVLSRIDVSTGTRDKEVQVAIDYEIPRAVVAEAIVNAIAHRDYTSHGSVQVMIFKDRIEIWNPGQLPPNLTLLNLRDPHGSFPANPLLAEPMYLAAYIERIGTGTRDIIRLC